MRPRVFREMTRHRQEGRDGRTGGRVDGREGARRRRSERWPWRGTGGLALWNALKGREQLSWLELFVGCGAKGEQAKEEERLSGGRSCFN